MNELCQIIKDTVKPNFLNIRTSIQTYDRNALCCGAPCWRWAYHALHSADKWFINPFVYEEPSFHEEGMDNPDNPTSVVLSDEELLSYLTGSKRKPWIIWIHLPMICYTKNRKNVSIRGWSLFFANTDICPFIPEC